MVSCSDLRTDSRFAPGRGAGWPTIPIGPCFPTNHFKTGTFGQPDLFDPKLTRHFLQYARRAHARISSSWHACMNEPASMTRHACCCCCCWLLCSSQQQLLAAAAAASSSQQQPAASSAQHPAWLLRGHAVASKPGCMLHGMSCCFKTGMHAAWHELLLQNRDACCMSCCFNSSSWL